MAVPVWKDRNAQLEIRAYLYVFAHACLYVSYPDTDSCNTMATVAFALTGAKSDWLLVLLDQRLHISQLRYS